MNDVFPSNIPPMTTFSKMQKMVRPCFLHTQIDEPLHTHPSSDLTGVCGCFASEGVEPRKRQEGSGNERAVPKQMESIKRNPLSLNALTLSHTHPTLSHTLHLPLPLPSPYAQNFPQGSPFLPNPSTYIKQPCSASSPSSWP